MTTSVFPLTAVAIALLVIASAAQKTPPVNDRPSLHELGRAWPPALEGRTLGAVSGIDIDRDGQSVRG